MKISPIWIFVGLLLLWILYLTQCNKKIYSIPTQITTIDTQRIISEYISNTSPHLDTVYLPGDTIWRKSKALPAKPSEPIFVEVVKEIPIRVDTQAIINSYYSKTIYKDSLIIPDKFRVFVTDTLYKNKITGRTWDVKAETQVITKTTIKRPWLLYGELGAYQSKALFISGGEITLGYLNRRGQGFEFSLLRTSREWMKGIKFHQTIFQSKQ